MEGLTFKIGSHVTQREHDFGKIPAFKKNTEKVVSGNLFWDTKWRKIDAGASIEIVEVAPT